MLLVELLEESLEAMENFPGEVNFSIWYKAKPLCGCLAGCWAYQKGYPVTEERWTPAGPLLVLDAFRFRTPATLEFRAACDLSDLNPIWKPIVLEGPSTPEKVAVLEHRLKILKEYYPNVAI